MAKITVLKQEVVTPTGKQYQVCELGYKTDEGKVKAMKIFGFGNQKAVFDVASKAQPGDVIEAQFVQNEKGYWQFSSLVPTGIKEATTAPTSQVQTSSPNRGNWETSEERAARQVMIVRQSSLSTAVSLIAARSPKGATEDANDVIDVAKRFEHYVLGKPQVTGEVE